MSLTEAIKNLASVDIFKEAPVKENFVGRPFYVDYDTTMVLVADYWKNKVGGIPQGSLLLAFYENVDNISEALLLRALKPTRLPTDNEIVSSMVEYYKDNLKTAGSDNQLDDFTRYEFSFSGLECRVLGTFYEDDQDKCVFGADVENFYSAHNYNVFKPREKILEYIVNLRDDDIVVGESNDFKIGNVRYSSSRRFQEKEEKVPVYINPKDFLGKRTAFFGMTRTGKSNTIKKIIEATVAISEKAPKALGDVNSTNENIDPFNDEGVPVYPVGQIIFDINGEYANANLQDEGTAIFELYKDDVIRYSVLEKEGFKVMKVNFYSDISSGFELVKLALENENSDYVNSFCAVELTEPEDTQDFSAITRYERQKAAYLCCLKAAGLKPPKGFKVKFQGNTELNKLVKADGSINPKNGISLDKATEWFRTVWSHYRDEFFTNYKQDKGREWADEDLKALLVFLTGRREGARNTNLSGYKKLAKIREQHTPTEDEPFQKDIINSLSKGKIVIADLSQGNPEIQNMYSEMICTHIFQKSLDRFIKNEPNNFVQLYFEEAHNLFPKKETTDLSQTYNRIAKEGAKLSLGLIYATQEVSSISANILKNTQNWFISHLNNVDELHELKKYYDFADFTDSLVKFSASIDKGFVRMKTYSNPFVVPVQIDKFTVKEDE
jgi:DNA helicase HerA-like ATPase